MASLALNRPVKEKNPSDIPMDQTHYWAWLDFTQQQEIHSIDTKLEYLSTCFGFIKGTHILAPDVLRTLKFIEDYYFHCVLLPACKERWTAEKAEAEEV